MIDLSLSLCKIKRLFSLSRKFKSLGVWKQWLTHLCHGLLVPFRHVQHGEHAPDARGSQHEAHALPGAAVVFPLLQYTLLHHHRHTGKKSNH